LSIIKRIVLAKKAAGTTLPIFTKSDLALCENRSEIKYRIKRDRIPIAEKKMNP